jgi:predicted permease
MRGELALTAIVLGIVGLVVLIAAANVTNVLLANAAGRTREIGTRLAIGASRGRVVRQLLTESLLLGTLSGVLGFVLAGWLTPLLARLIPTFNLDADPLVFGFVTALTLIIGTAAGLAPARYIHRSDLISSLKTDRLGAPSAVRPGRLRSGLIAIQAAASIVLLVLAALLTRSVAQATSMDLGYDADRVASLSVNLGRSYTDARTRAFWNAALPHLRQMPGIAGAALATPGPFGGQAASHATDGRYLHRVLASDGYFAAMGQKIIAGRAYTDDDVRSGAAVAVISESLARRYWGSENPLGSTLERVWGQDDPVGAAPRTRGLIAKPAGTRVIGVISDTVLALANVDRLCVYLPLTDDALRSARLVVRTEGNVPDTTNGIRDLLRSIDADPALSVRTSVVRDEVNRELQGPQVLAALSAVTGGTALGLAVVGLFGVTAFAVGQRVHEVGVRLTLGATTGQILAMLVRDGLRPVIIGLGGGLVLALLLGGAVESTLYGVSGHDPIAVTAAIAILLAAASAAILIPARRAARINPSQMLRES